MKRFNEDFKTKLYQIIEDIETDSHVEIVTIIKSASDRYRDVSILFGSIVMFISFSFMMFSPINFNFYLIYFLSIISFFAAYFASELIDKLKIRLINKKRITKTVEIYGRALFQKGGIRFTDDKIGVLIFVSVFEKKVFILKDRGAETAIPDAVNKQMQGKFNEIFNSADLSNELLKKLESSKEIFTEYIPQVEYDVNELPDNLEINL